jgi:predicted acylesterase/phospholipase RssA
VNEVVPIRGRRTGTSRIGLALAGGAPEGAVYEIGALLALSEALDGLDLNHLHIYVGVSSGAILGACLANGIHVEEILRGITSRPRPGDNPFRAETLFTPARAEYLQRLLTVPRVLGEAVWDYLARPGEMTLLESLSRLTRSLPVAIFDNEPLRRYLAALFAEEGRTDDFRRLGPSLRVVTTELDSAQATVFGRPGLDDVPISRALQASAALPGLYPPVLIDGRYYVDGVLLKTLHASVAMEEGADLLLAINPIVPVDTSRAVEEGVMRRGNLIDRGLPTVLAQTFRTLIRSRLGVGMRAYDTAFPDADVILFEPPRDDYKMFFTNVFSWSDRRTVCEHAYRRTRADLLSRREELEPILARHGIRLRLDVLRDPERGPWGEGEVAEVERSAKERNALPEVERLHRALDRLDRFTA